MNLQYKNFLLKDVVNTKNDNGGYISLVLLVTDAAGVPVDVERQSFFLKNTSQASSSMRIWLKGLEPEGTTPLPKRDFLVYVQNVKPEEADEAIIELALARFRALIGTKFKGTVETVKLGAPTFKTATNILPYVKENPSATEADEELEIGSLAKPKSVLETAPKVEPAGNAEAFAGLEEPANTEDGNEIKALV